ncbi:dihydrofolate reductase [Methylomonas rhizoryzae]|uniref:dihydrofolate reductase n=1 Tax=Methylomonas rhizoryzae TaxID=2608981 RepID=UPI001231BE26|nr:dihydrofolate reductase [Methylomonas rhizoryzae]
MKISLIAAMAANRVIGANGQMPWHLPADLRRFKQITWGAPILMGRKTYQAIGKPLPGRDNLIISRNSGFSAPGCRVFTRIDEALNYAADAPELFVIGGATLYQALLPVADCLYLTLIDKAFDGDTLFPDVDRREWRQTNCERVDNAPGVDFAYRFVTLQRMR